METRIIKCAPDYSVSEDGTITRINPGRCTRVGKVLKPYMKDGYPAIALRRGGRIVKRLVHRIVCEAYHGPPPSKIHHAAHNDGNPANCHASNLRWATPKENNADKKKHGTSGRTYAKLTKEQVAVIRKKPYKIRNGEMAKKMNVSRSSIYNIRNPSHGCWPDVPFT